MYWEITLSVLLILSTAPSCGALWKLEWEEWKAIYSRKYVTTEDEAAAHVVWEKNMAFILAHNNRTDVTYTLEMNKFGDQDWRQPALFKTIHEDGMSATVMGVSGSKELGSVPAGWDWRTKGVLTPVKDQGMMSRPDVFVITEEMESLHAIKSGHLVNLSLEEVADCCSSIPGMLVPAIFECIHKIGGLCSQASYPVGAQCGSAHCPPVANEANHTIHIPKGDETAMVKAVLTTPLSVYIDASQQSFQFYKSGVYADPACSHTVDHALQLVGYGKDKGVPYWILRNSWGSDWGMKGYMYMKRGVDMCAVEDYALFPK